MRHNPAADGAEPRAARGRLSNYFFFLPFFLAFFFAMAGSLEGWEQQRTRAPLIEARAIHATEMAPAR